MALKGGTVFLLCCAVLVSCQKPPSTDQNSPSKKNDVCESFKSGEFKPAKFKPASKNMRRPVRPGYLAKQIKKCFSTDADMLTNIDKLLPLMSSLTPKMKKKLIEIAIQDATSANAYDKFLNLGSGAKFLGEKMDTMMKLLNVDDLKNLMKNSTIDLTKKQKRVMLDKYLLTKKCQKLSKEDLADLTEVMDQLPKCYYKKMDPADLTTDVLKKMTKKIKKSQGIAMLKVMGTMSEAQMIELPELAKVLPLGKLKNMEIAWEKMANVPWRPGQAKLLAKKMIKDKNWYKTARGPILQGVTCQMIKDVAEAEEMSQNLANSAEWLSIGQARCTAKKLFATLESKRADYFKTITVDELNKTAPVFLLQLPPGKVKDLPDSVCPIFLEKMQMSNLSSLPLKSASRAALTKRALSCLGEEVSTRNMTTLGPLLCEVPPSALRPLTKDILRTSLQAMALCDYIPTSHRTDLVQLINVQPIGPPAEWDADTVEDLGPLLVLFDSTPYSLSLTQPGMKDAVSTLIQLLKSPPEFLKKTLFELTLSDTSSDTAARRKRQVTVDTLITAELIEDLGLQNVYWSPDQLGSMTIAVFNKTVDVLGSVTTYSSAQLTKLVAKATEHFGAPAIMTEANVEELGCIARGFTDDQLKTMAFPIESLVDIAKCGWESTQIAAVWKSVSTHRKLTAQTLEASDMVELSGFMCGLSAEDINQLNQSAFTEAVPSMDGLKCSLEKTKLFKPLALAAFGSPNTWTGAEVSDLGTFIAGLESTEFASLAVSVFQDISKDCIPLIPPMNLRALSLDQIEALGPDNAGMVTDDQKRGMTEEQQGVLSKLIGEAKSSQNSVPPLVNQGIAVVFAVLGLALLWF